MSINNNFIADSLYITCVDFYYIFLEIYIYIFHCVYRNGLGSSVQVQDGKYSGADSGGGAPGARPPKKKKKERERERERGGGERREEARRKRYVQ